MIEPKRLLVLGTGHIAAKHAEQFGLIPGCTLVAAVDANGERAPGLCGAARHPAELRNP